MDELPIQVKPSSTEISELSGLWIGSGMNVYLSGLTLLVSSSGVGGRKPRLALGKRRQAAALPKQLLRHRENQTAAEGVVYENTCARCHPSGIALVGCEALALLLRKARGDWRWRSVNQLEKCGEDAKPRL
jgi:hypothetical protein